MPARTPDGEPTWPYDLKVKNYEELRHLDFQVPRILVVVAVPEDVSRWVEQDDERMLLRHCGWWVSLRGRPASSNDHTVRVGIPRDQRFDVAGLRTLMNRIAEGDMP